MPGTLKDMSSWTGRTALNRLRSFVDEESGTFWLEQNSAWPLKWAKLARDGHDVAWEFAGQGGSYTGHAGGWRSLHALGGDEKVPEEEQFLKRA